MFTDDVIRQHWDVSKSPSWNMAALGLRATPNNEDVDRVKKKQKDDDGDRIESSNGNGSGSNIIELYDIPDSDTLAEQSRLKKKYKYPISEEEQRYIVSIMKKYRRVADASGRDDEKETDEYDYDYDAASRDHKLNYMHHSEGQLRKLAARYQLLDDDQKVVDL